MISIEPIKLSPTQIDEVRRAVAGLGCSTSYNALASLVSRRRELTSSDPDLKLVDATNLVFEGRPTELGLVSLAEYLYTPGRPLTPGGYTYPIL